MKDEEKFLVVGIALLIAVGGGVYLINQQGLVSEGYADTAGQATERFNLMAANTEVLDRTVLSDTTVLVKTGKIRRLYVEGRFIGSGSAKIWVDSSDGEKVVWETVGEPLAEVVFEESSSGWPIQTALAYGGENGFDEDDDGIEFASAAIDYSVAGTDVSEYDTTKLCTRWAVNDIFFECDGDELCCGVAKVPIRYNDWDAPFYLHTALDSTGYANKVSSQVIFFDITETDIVTKAGSIAHLQGYFIDDEVFTEITGCGETCVFESIGADLALNVEVENGVLYLDSITYSLFDEVEPTTDVGVVDE